MPITALTAGMSAAVCVQFAVRQSLCYGGDGVRWWQGVRGVCDKEANGTYVSCGSVWGGIESEEPLGRTGEKRRRACGSTTYLFVFFLWFSMLMCSASSPVAYAQGSEPCY